MRYSGSFPQPDEAPRRRDLNSAILARVYTMDPSLGLVERYKLDVELSTTSHNIHILPAIAPKVYVK
jgi:hypothetical protein